MEDFQNEFSGSVMSFGEHLEELRGRLFSCLFAFVGTLIVCFIDQNFYMSIVLAPHIATMEKMNLATTIQVLKYEESFFCHFKVAIIASLIMTTPFTLLQIWGFIAEGLHESEKKYLRSFFPFTILFFLCGVLFGYFILVPLGLQFLGSYGENIQIGITLSSYISLFFLLTFLCGLVFELPLFMLLLNRLRILRSEYFIKNWRYAVLISFIIAAVLTPPDVVTQLLMAGPMIFLYFSGIFLCQILERSQEIRHYFLQQTNESNIHVNKNYQNENVDPNENYQNENVDPNECYIQENIDPNENYQNENVDPNECYIQENIESNENYQDENVKSNECYNDDEVESNECYNDDKVEPNENVVPNTNL
ncbi:MAG: twin-arginine translocase subunit TatC [Planctomycetes bacterium]|nr:twin-arginine translocase subunit TatC [Planctomycetota bacterium]